MNKIKPANPVVVSLPEDEQIRNTFSGLLNCDLYMNCDDGTVTFHEYDYDEPENLTGIEAVRLLSWLVGFKLEEVTEIDVEDIVAKCDDLGMLDDIIHLLYRVDNVNKKLALLIRADAPKFLQDWTKAALQKSVEQLAHNCECDEPFTWETDDGEEIAASLSCIGYKL